MAAAEPPVYDSAARRSAVLEALGALRRHWDVVGLLASRNLVVRYKRSVIGLWWTALNPLATAGILWLVFSQVFRMETQEVPYIVYMLAGVLLASLFSTTVLSVGGSIFEHAPTLTRMPVQPILFAVAAALSSLLTFGVTLGVLLIVMVVHGVSIPLTLPLAVIPVAFVVMQGIGVGLVVAIVAVRYPDTFDVTRVVLQLVTWLTPTFYTLEALPERAQDVIAINPLADALFIFRDFTYGAAGSPAWWTWAIAAGTAVAMVLIGIVVFARAWRTTGAML